MTEMFGEAWSPMSVPDLAPDDDDDGTFVIKENKLCLGLIYLNGELMITGSLLRATSTKQVGSTCMQCTIKGSNGPTVHLLNDMTPELASPQGLG